MKSGGRFVRLLSPSTAEQLINTQPQQPQDPECTTLDSSIDIKTRRSCPIWKKAVNFTSPAILLLLALRFYYCPRAFKCTLSACWQEKQLVNALTILRDFFHG